MRGIFLRIESLFQQHLETSLREMTVRGERLRYSFAIHYHKRNRISEGPILVGAVAVEVNSQGEGFSIGSNNNYVMIGLKIIKQGMKLERKREAENALATSVKTQAVVITGDCSFLVKCTARA